jgi:tRNA nucleotidyltransferase (CCA-adding enzyme)
VRAVFLYYALLVFRLDSPELESLLARLNVARYLADGLRQVTALRQHLPALEGSPRPSQIVRLLEDYEPRALAALWVCAEDPTARAAIADYLTRLRSVVPLARGETLKALGLRPGPRFGQILRALREAWLDGQVADASAEQALLARLIA